MNGKDTRDQFQQVVQDLSNRDLGRPSTPSVEINDLANKPYNTAWLDGKISVLQNEIEHDILCFQTKDDGKYDHGRRHLRQCHKSTEVRRGDLAYNNQKDGAGWMELANLRHRNGFTADEMNTGTLLALVNVISTDGNLITPMATDCGSMTTAVICVSTWGNTQLATSG